MSEPCEQCTCVIPEGQRMGFCERHQCKKTAHWVELCQRDQAVYFASLAAGEKIKPSLWTQWETGIGPAQVTAVEWAPDQPPSPPPSGGVGTELKLILKLFGIVAQPNCKCGQRAREMDSNGPEWCVEHIEEITDWLEEEAKRRDLPFVRLAAVVLIRRAIKNAKRKEKMMMQDDPIHRLANSVEMSPAPEAFQ